MAPPRLNPNLATVVIGASLHLITTAASAQVRVLNYNVAGLAGDTTALRDVLAEAAADNTRGFAVAPAALVFQEVHQQDISSLADVIADALPDDDYVLATYTTSPAEDGAGGGQALFFRSGFLVEVVADHLDIPTGAGRNADRWRLRLAGYDSPNAGFYLYSAHLKAGDTPQDQAARLAGAAALRSNIASLPAGASVIVCGDLNLANNGEPAYLELIAPGAGQTLDPLGSGSWSGPAHAIVHTQSPRDITADGLIGGGMDDRFDLQLLSPFAWDDDGFSFIAGTYRALGNDGLHYNLSINAGNNVYFPGDVARSNALADAIFDASDHVPVIADYQVPAVMSVALREDFGRVIQDNAVTLDVLIANIANVVAPQGADELAFTVTGSGVLSGAFEGVVGALPDLATIHVPVNTTNLGFVEGGVTVVARSDATQHPLWMLDTEGFVVRPSNGSFSGAVNQDLLVRSWQVNADSGIQALELPIFNFGFDAFQALLDVDALSGVSGRFIQSGPLPLNIGGSRALIPLAFDTSGARPGIYSASISISVSDEDIPGEKSSTLLLFASVEVVSAAVPGDLDGDGMVTGADLGMLLGAWGACDGCAADLDGNGVVDGADLGALLGLWN